MNCELLKETRKQAGITQEPWQKNSATREKAAIAFWKTEM